jgi:hypothetical protein
MLGVERRGSLPLGLTPIFSFGRHRARAPEVPPVLPCYLSTRAMGALRNDSPLLTTYVRQ